MDAKAKLRAASFALQAVFQIGQELRSGRLEPDAAAEKLEASAAGLKEGKSTDGGRGKKPKKAKKAKKDKRDKKSKKAKGKNRKDKAAKKKSDSGSSAESSSAVSQASDASVIDVDRGKPPKKAKKEKKPGKPAKATMPAVPAGLGVLTIDDSASASEGDCVEADRAAEPAPGDRAEADRTADHVEAHDVADSTQRTDALKPKEHAGPEPTAFNGSWVSAAGERVDIAGRMVSAGEGTAVPMSGAGEDWFTLDISGEEALTARLSASRDRLEWNDGDVWRLLPSSVVAGPSAAGDAARTSPEAENLLSAGAADAAEAASGPGPPEARGGADGSEVAAQAVLEARLQKEESKRRKDEAKKDKEAKRARKEARRAAKEATGEDEAKREESEEDEEPASGDDGGADRRLAESCYAEDALEHGHSAVWGSWYDAGAKRWGYACCRCLCRGIGCSARGAGGAAAPEASAESAASADTTLTMRGVNDLPPRDAFKDSMGFLVHWAQAVFHDWRRGLSSGSAVLLAHDRFGRQEQLAEAERSMSGLMAKIQAASAHFFLNEAVHVWSVGNCCWMRDGKVLDILEAETAVSGSKTPADGCVMPAGSLLVSFCDGVARKWLAPDQFEGRIRKARAKELDKDDLEVLDRIATLALEREYQAANQAYVELTMGRGRWHGSLSLRGQFGCAKAPRNGQKVIQDRASILDTEESKEFVMGMKRLLAFLQLVRPNEDVSKHANL